METLHEFAKILSKNLGCYSHQCKSGIVSLKKNKTNLHGDMGVFAWIRELKGKGIFEISTYKDLAEKAGVCDLSSGEKPRMHWNDTGIFFFVERDRKDTDYQNALKALIAILRMK